MEQVRARLITYSAFCLDVGAFLYQVADDIGLERRTIGLRDIYDAAVANCNCERRAFALRTNESG